MTLTNRIPMALRFCVSLLLVACSVVKATDKPNVILIVADDQGYGDVRSHDNPLIDTPNLDQLAKDGARFKNFFVSPLCAPTRASLLTGRYHIRTGNASL